MRNLDLLTPQPNNNPERVARLARHLAARLQDFGPGGPQVLECNQSVGMVRAQFPGHTAAQVLERLQIQGGVSAALEGDAAVFYLSPHTQFEDLDYLWGLLFEVLS